MKQRGRTNEEKKATELMGRCSEYRRNCITWPGSWSGRCLAVASKAAVLPPCSPCIYHLLHLLKYTDASLNCGKADVGHVGWVFAAQVLPQLPSCWFGENKREGRGGELLQTSQFGASSLVTLAREKQCSPLSTSRLCWADVNVKMT